MPGDVLIEAIFENPYSDPNLRWEHGFFFRVGEPDHLYKVSLESDGDWEKYAKLGSGNYIEVIGTPSPSLRTKPGERNLLQIVLTRGATWVYINSRFVGSFPTDIDTGGDRVSLFIYDEHVGSTDFEEFVIWRWDSSMYRDFPEADPANVPTPTPRPTATPTPTLTPTPTPMPNVWRASGNWQRDTVWEAQLKEIGGVDGTYKMATLSPDPTSYDNEVYLSLGCINGLTVAYLNHYARAVPAWVDFYVIGIWDTRASEWSDQYYSYENPFITLDGASIYLYNPVQVRQVLELLHFADQNRKPHWELNAGMYSIEDESKPGFWGAYDVTGLEDALAYLTCFEGVQ